MTKKKKQKVILTKGLVCSGKSSWAEEFITKNQDYKRINRDLIRKCLSNYTFNNSNEQIVTNIEHEMLDNLLRNGYNVVIDETHLNPEILKETIRDIENFAELYNLDVEIEIKEFEVSLEEAIIRDRIRGIKGGLSVGQKVIERMYFKYIYKEHQENLIEYDPKLPDCLIVDVDGTLALKGKRNPFDYSKVSQDKPNKPIIDLLKLVTNRMSCEDKVFIFSGRENTGNCYKDTYNWLNANYINFDELVMRNEKDMRKDYLIKIEMYEEHIKGKYNVLYWIDDRKQVIDEIRKLGITVLDVAGHLF